MKNSISYGNKKKEQEKVQENQQFYNTVNLRRKRKKNILVNSVNKNCAGRSLCVLYRRIERTSICLRLFEFFFGREQPILSF